MKLYFSTLCCTLLLPLFLSAQIPKKQTSADIYKGLKKLNFLGSVLYVAAHPDDENTRLISYFSNEIHAETAYLAMTRGDGGQNLIGNEIRESLGVIRTQELLAARRIDGAQQFFTRANDFGYSKNPTETFNIWGKQSVLNDVVWIFRKFRPDVIINRFNIASAGKTHGHHTASAILSNEAFGLSADKKAFPNQLNSVKPWQPKRMFFNTSWFFYGSKEKFAKSNKTDLYQIDAGVFYPLKGKSNNELAADARTQHKSQGFGSREVRGSSIEYLKWLHGSKPSDKDNIFSGINTTWTRLKGGKPIGSLVSKIDDEFDFVHPEKSIPNLIKVYKLIKALPQGHWRDIKLKETAQLIQSCAGLFVEALAVDGYFAASGSTINLSIEAINRSNVSVVLRTFSIKNHKTLQNPNQDLSFNKDFNFKENYTIPPDAEISNAYWLNKKSGLGLFNVSNKKYIGLAETPPALVLQFIVSVDGYSLPLETPVVYKKIDPVRGEVYRRFEIAPPVFSNIKAKVNIFSDNQPKKISVLVKAGRDSLNGELSLDVNKSWKVTPIAIPVSLKHKGDEKTFEFEVIAPKNQAVAEVKPVVKVNGRSFSNGFQNINYSHIPPQLITSPTSVKFVRLAISRRGQNIAYIMGAGDEIPTSLQQIGYSVMILKDADITPENLKHFDAVILGVRAYNTDENLKYKQQILHQYVANGGTMIVQYNTNFRLKVNQVAPYPLHLSRDRVTVEDAKVSLLNPNNEILNYPNKITKADFDGWVQERGLYFPDSWDAHFTPILGMNDPGEKEKKGSLLVAKYKKGYFIYTGLSFFRELPAGVPGAYKLFTNMISIGKNQDKQIIKQ